jgi:malonate-semialdehyde dehydrogenase (acetylating)/methylmalonate-semialdehyde dehydrogenase
MVTSAVSADLKKVPIIIGGKQQMSKGKTAVQTNPATGEAVALIPYCTNEEISAAVEAAQKAFPAWSQTPVLQRARIMFKYRQLLEQHADELIRLCTEENGKILEESKGSYQRGIECVEFAAGVPSLMMGETLERVSAGVDSALTRQPLGVCVGITPFNFPLMVPLWMFPLAIACGNTFVLKPSEKDPSASQLTAELLKEAGLPDGVFNVVHGDKVAVDSLLEHPDISAISFVGSTPIAKYVYEKATAAGKRCQALGGAKNHMVVLPDADVDAAADAAVSAGYGSAGERCMAVSVVVAVGDVAQQLVDAIKERIPKVKVGDGMDPSSEMGPLVTREHRDRVASYVENAPVEGATVVVDGREGVPDDGFFLNPSLLDGVTPAM